MHIGFILIGIVVTILVLLKKLSDEGISLGGLNPFRVRVRTVTKTVDPPVYRLNSPLEAAGLLLVSRAKVDGDMTTEDKAWLLSVFQEQLHLTDSEATSLLRHSAELFGDGVAVRENLQEVLEPVMKQFTDEQGESIVSMMEQLACIDGNPHALKLELVASTKTQFEVYRAGKASTWGR
jgi:uncharacterized tellurite resistance protein B-like protein